MQKRNPIQTGALDFDRIKDKDFSKIKIDTLIRGLRKGMPISSCCDLAQIRMEQLNVWMDKYEDFGALVKSAKAAFLEKLFDSLNSKSEDNASTAIRFFSEIRKMEKDEENINDTDNISDDLFDIVSEMDK